MKKVLVPFDMSDNAIIALDYALQFCAAYGISLQVFHVSATSPYQLASGADEKELERRMLQDQSQKETAIKQIIAERSTALGIHLPPDGLHVKAGYNPLVVEKIIEVAGQSGADLIIMSTHGASGISKVLFGSNTSAMISKSLIPVLVIPVHCVYKPVAKIMYASDLEKLKPELKILTRLLRGIHPAVEILHFDFGMDMSGLSDADIHTIISETGYTPLQPVIRKATLDKPLLHHIREYSRQHHPAWVLMFTKERSFWQKLFGGSKTEDLAYSPEFPLLSIRKPE